ncbi:MAG TPA: DUF2330 domain-containing protein [Candidatus Binatia bacterium]|nr:DUF2330 domain-containing protein [Candidatus Binatia bacterium]
MEQDARVWQVTVLGGVLLFGVFSLDFPLSFSLISCTLASAVLGEYLLSLCRRVGRGPRPLSAVISALSVLLLFRSTVFWTYPLVTLISLGSKYVIRCRGRHWLNPTNCGVLLGVLLLPGWLSSGQWGHMATLPLALGGLGVLVLLRAGRLDSALTFLAVSALLELARITYYGYPPAVFLHRCDNGALWLFTFYMLTDPKTTPQRRSGRVAHASVVALLAFFLAEWWYWKDTFLWALLFVAPLVPLLDWLQVYTQQPVHARVEKEKFTMKRQLACISPALVGLALLWPARLQAFCGFYVARADSTLYNSASQVVVVRDEDKTVLTMVNNYKGDPQEFALVVPVPVVLEREMVRVIDPQVVTHLDAYSAPRLVEYFDPDPCVPQPRDRALLGAGAGAVVSEMAARRKGESALGVTVEAEYTVGEYDIVILSAKESEGLETWLKQNSYNIPAGASQALAPYIRGDMKFFVAKVNLKEQARSGYTSLRPLQFAFASSRFMLPIRLGMLNADGPQELLIYFLTKRYRVEVTNYRNPKLPSDMEIPAYVKEEFKQFYTDMFATALTKENQQAVFTEYAWNMGWCDPCAAEPLSRPELEALGVWWLDEQPGTPIPGLMPMPRPVPGGMPAFVTRLHVRYDARHFPEDLAFKITQDSDNFQGRYVIRHPWTGAVACPAGQEYLKQLAVKQEARAQILATLTGWDLQQIHARMPAVAAAPEQSWAERIKALFKK